MCEGQHGLRQHRGVVEGVVRPNLEDVEGENSRDGNQKANGRGDQRLSDGTHDCRASAFRLGARAESVEGHDNAKNRAEEAEEGGIVAERREEPEEALVALVLPLNGAVHELARRLVAAPDVTEAVHRDTGLHAVARVPDEVGGLVRRSVLKRLDHQPTEGERVDLVRPIEPEALHHDGERDHAQDDEDPEHPLRSRVRYLQELAREPSLLVNRRQQYKSSEIHWLFRTRERKTKLQPAWGHATPKKGCRATRVATRTKPDCQREGAPLARSFVRLRAPNFLSGAVACFT